MADFACIGKILRKSTKKLAHIQKKAYFCTKFRKNNLIVYGKDR